MRMPAPLLAALTLAYSSAWAVTPAEARASLAEAQQAEAVAMAAKAAWVPTEAALNKARKAVADGNWAEAKAAADEALALARLSVEQAEEQKTAWRDAVFR